MEANDEERGGKGGSKSSFFCRQSSTRWIPTSEQIRILRDLYYNTGLRSPTTEQIQRISATLRQYGKIEGKNVFYWFQNHKARERQKKRLTVDLLSPTTTKYSTATVSPGLPSACSSPGLYDAGHMGSSGVSGGGSVLMERSFSESFVSGGGGGGDVPAGESNMGWMALDTSTMPWVSTYDYSFEPQAIHREMETLPLFPIHSQEQEEQEEREEVGGSLSHTASNRIDCNWTEKPMQSDGYLPAFYWPAGGQKLENGGEEEDHLYVYDDNHFHHNSNNATASLELTLNSYYCAPPGSA